MGIPVSLLLIALGAILTWAVEDNAEGVNLAVVGVILMLVGLVGFLLSLLFWSSWGGPGYFRRATYVDAPPSRRRYYGPWARRRATYVEDEAPPGPPPGGPPPPP